MRMSVARASDRVCRVPDQASPGQGAVTVEKKIPVPSQAQYILRLAARLGLRV